MSSKKRNNSVFRAFTLVMQFGINMLVPIFLCLLLGMLIYRKTGAAWPLILLLFAGALAGFRNCYVQAKKVYETDEKTDRKAK
ncbi:MAG: AtpZ/AtpI family protein [Lachnospiraceae bacterium]|nr:AtpZ/AtpI family protein [Lachnospiraceae bacterium]